MKTMKSASVTMTTNKN